MKDALYGILLVILGYLTLPLLDGDGTFLVFAIILAVFLIFKDKKFPGEIVGKTWSIMKNKIKGGQNYDK